MHIIFIIAFVMLWSHPKLRSFLESIIGLFIVAFVVFVALHRMGFITIPHQPS